MRLKLSNLFLFSVLYSFNYVLAIKSIPCEKENHCVCLYENGEAIDLTPFNITSTNPNFLFASNATVAYLYQPCVDQTLGNQTEKAVLWKFTAPNTRDAALTLTLDEVLKEINVNGTNSTIVPLGVGDTANFIDTELNINAAKISYTKNDKQSVVSLVCNLEVTTSLSIADKVLSPYVNSLVLTSPVVCAHVPEVHTLSTGSVILLIFFIVGSFYFFGGMLVKKYLMGATGIEMIPNIDFWTSLPGLVRDGIKFAMSCGKSSGVPPYEEI